MHACMSCQHVSSTGSVFLLCEEGNGLLTMLICPVNAAWVEDRALDLLGHLSFLLLDPIGWESIARICRLAYGIQVLLRAEQLGNLLKAGLSSEAGN